jgi:hypothetical protein
VDAGFDIGIRESWQAALEDPLSNHKYGGLGYVGFAGGREAALEGEEAFAKVP